MANILAMTAEMSRDEWLKHRMKGIGGSDAATVAGLNKWKSPVQLWLEKTGQVEPEETGEAAYWGTVLEEVVAKEFSRRTGLKVRRRNAILQHPEHPFMIANVDRMIVGQNVGLECKTASAYLAKEWQGDEVPASYLIQCQHYMAVTGASRWWIAVLIGGNTFLYKPIDRDDELIAGLIELESDFWRRVESGEPPEMDGSEASSKLMNRMYPESMPESSIDLPSEAEKLIEDYLQAKADEKAAAERVKEAENRLKQLMGENETGIIAGEPRVTWKTVTKKLIDSKRLKAEAPEIYEQYSKVSSYRQFSVK